MSDFSPGLPPGQQERELGVTPPAAPKPGPFHAAAPEPVVPPPPEDCAEWDVRIVLADRDSRSYVAALVDAKGDCELWHGKGYSLQLALVDLIENMADELEARASYLPDAYVDLDVRQPGYIHPPYPVVSPPAAVAPESGVSE